MKTSGKNQRIETLGAVGTATRVAGVVDTVPVPHRSLSTFTTQRDEIVLLHTELTGLAGTVLEKAQRIGQLLVEVREKIGHGQWLPWLKKNVPFTDRSARNYVAVYEHRDRIKLESVSDLTSAYKMLAAPTEPEEHEVVVAANPKFVPSKGCGLMGHGTFKGLVWIVNIEPYTTEGFYHIAIESSEARRDSAGAVEGTKKPARADSVEYVLDLLFGAIGDGWRDVVEWHEYEVEPQRYNQWLYWSYDDYLENALGIKREDMPAPAESVA
jgi:hypothetical protein